MFNVKIMQHESKTSPSTAIIINTLRDQRPPQSLSFFQLAKAALRQKILAAIYRSVENSEVFSDIHLRELFGILCFTVSVGLAAGLIVLAAEENEDAPSVVLPASMTSVGFFLFGVLLFAPRMFNAFANNYVTRLRSNATVAPLHTAINLPRQNSRPPAIEVILEEDENDEVKERITYK